MFLQRNNWFTYFSQMQSIDKRNFLIHFKVIIFNHFSCISCHSHWTIINKKIAARSTVFVKIAKHSTPSKRKQLQESISYLHMK